MRRPARDGRPGRRADPDRPGGRPRAAHGPAALAELPARPRLRRASRRRSARRGASSPGSARGSSPTTSWRSASTSIACRSSTCRSRAPTTSSATAPTASDPQTVAVLGRAAAEGLLAGGVLPVIKHIPGHGRAFADSHLALPVVDTPPRGARGPRFRAVPDPRRHAARDDGPRGLHGPRPGPPGDHLAGGHERDHPRPHRLSTAS